VSTLTAEWLNRIHVGDCRTLMKAMAAAGVRVQCIVTSPPYWGLRDYGAAGQFGLERTWLRHVARMRGVFRQARELLTEDGTMWMNYGDSYHSPRPNGGVGYNSTLNGSRHAPEEFRKARRRMQYRQAALKPKDLIGMPWRVAFALQADGWWLRSDVVWHKPNPMPESVRDRPTKAHEYLFLMSRSERYYWDKAGAREPVTGNAHGRGNGVNPKARKTVSGWGQGPGVSHDTLQHAKVKADAGTKLQPRAKQNESFSAAVADLVDDRNMRTVWTIPTEPFAGAHFAAFPRDLVRRCILASTRPGDVVFDPFMGSGTVAQVADELGRQWVGCELNPEYAAMYGKLRPAQLGMGLVDG
jgi:DNA modification methylase